VPAAPSTLATTTATVPVGEEATSALVASSEVAESVGTGCQNPRTSDGPNAAARRNQRASGPAHEKAKPRDAREHSAQRGTTPAGGPALGPVNGSDLVRVEPAPVNLPLSRVTAVSSDPVSTSDPSSDPDVPTSGRSLSTVGFVVLVVVYLAIVQLVPFVSTAHLDNVAYASFPDSETVWWSLVVPVGISFLFAAGVASWLGWWPQMLRDHRPVNRWVWFVPVVMILAVALGTDYGTVGDKSVGYLLLLLLGAGLVGVTEETVFRGIGVTAFRANGFTEPRVALWTSVIFGLAHGSNVLSPGPSAFIQVLTTAIAGFFFYLVLRVTGLLVMAMALHGLWDAGLFTGNTTDQPYIGGVVFLLANLLIAIVLLVRRRRVGLNPATVTRPSHH
jgi:membrane protease YdiL (CAAX protease family)